ncbi:MAG: hypothetical protein A2Z31_07405 [candidate division NC10 bacterium RBG_16_65_8]|nr:MAG: hypothetical protein A2Z31_07405 [candidate division NC10 bacterium RBG_16_65_8]
MRYLLLACLFTLGIAFELGLLLLTLDDRFEPFDLGDPPTLIRTAASRLRELGSRVSDLRVDDLHLSGLRVSEICVSDLCLSDLVDTIAAPYRKQHAMR